MHETSDSVSLVVKVLGLAGEGDDGLSLTVSTSGQNGYLLLKEGENLGSTTGVVLW